VFGLFGLHFPPQQNVLPATRLDILVPLGLTVLPSFHVYNSLYDEQYIAYTQFEVTVGRIDIVHRRNLDLHVIPQYSCQILSLTYLICFVGGRTYH